MTAVWVGDAGMEEAMDDEDDCCLMGMVVVVVWKLENRQTSDFASDWVKVPNRDIRGNMRRASASRGRLRMHACRSCSNI